MQKRKKKFLQSGNNELPSNKEISYRLASMETLKKVMKKTMPFVQMIRENLATHGISALDMACPFDQTEVLKEVAAC